MVLTRFAGQKTLMKRTNLTWLSSTSDSLDNILFSFNVTKTQSCLLPAKRSFGLTITNFLSISVTLLPTAWSLFGITKRRLNCGEYKAQTEVKKLIIFNKVKRYFSLDSF